MHTHTHTVHLSAQKIARQNAIRYNSTNSVHIH